MAVWSPQSISGGTCLPGPPSETVSEVPGMRFLLQAFVLAIATALSAQAQENIFLKIGEIPGESTAAGHEKEIEVLAWSWGLTNAGLGKAQWAHLNISKLVDKATPRFLSYATQGRVISNAVLTLTAGPSAREYYRVTLEDVRVSGAGFNGNFNVLGARETVGLAFSRMNVNYLVAAPDGTVKESVAANWNLLSNTGGTGGTAPINATFTFNAGASAGQLKWAAIAGKTYEVLLSTSPGGPFTTFGRYTADAATQMTVSVPFDQPRAFFRIRQL